MSGINLSDWALKHRSLVVYMMMIAVVGGALSYFRLGRNEDPAFIIKTMVVQAAWPGATVEETMKQVTERLERHLQETPHLDFLRSFTRAGVATVFVNLKGSANAKQVADTWYHVRKTIGDMRHTLPAGVIGPGFNDEFGDTFGIIYGFTSDGFTQRELRDRVEDIRSRLLLVPDVSKIELLGEQDEVIFVEFSTKELAALGIDRSALIAALQSQNIVRPAGTIQTGLESISIRVSGSFQSEQDIANINFSAGGRMLRLSDIAQVRRGYTDPPQPMFRINGKPAIGLAIAMRDGGDILALGANIRKAMAQITADLPIGIEPSLVADQPVVVDQAIREFTVSLLQAIGIIMVVSFISLGVRPGLIIALAIPFTLAIVFPIMGLLSIDMQRISLGALIIALALLVDDAMTTTDATLSRLAEGASKIEAATFAYRTHAMAMLAGTLVTIAGFIPVGFAASSAGEYTFSLFAVVTIALLVSWFVAVIFTPLLGAAILVPPKQTSTADPGRIFRMYRSFLTFAMRAKWLTIAISLALFACSVLALPLIPRQFFPSSDRPELLVDLSLPQNSSIHASEAAAKRLDAALSTDADVARWSTYVGRGAIRFYLPLNVQLPNDFFTQAVVIAKDVAARERLHSKLEKLLAQDFPNAIAFVSPLELGPPVGWPVQYRVSGPDVERVREIALKVGQIVASSPDTKQVNFDWMEPNRQVRIRVDQNEARLLGLSSQAIATVLNTVISGTPITQVRDDIYLVNVVARATNEQRGSLDGLRNLQVALPGGQTVPLSQFASFEYDQEFPLVWRRDRIPTLTVQAAIAGDKLPESVVTSLAMAIENFRKSLPSGYSVVVGGTVEESQKSQASVLAVVPVMLLVMFTVLMVQLQSFPRLFMVLSVAPLGLIGVVAALMLSGRPLGFVAILGVLALLGMISKNAVILIGQIDAERALGKTAWDAAVDASSSRFRPIMLTAVSTVLGMIPIAPTVFWGPMAFAIMGGLLVATVLTLVFLPTLYIAWFARDKKEQPSARSRPA
ncbi:multidrug efflux pump subunit AcrB [Bradyrhizobium japonicum]|uniref:efflux RND transporter permease subunit n=1 Tax=Bradyrhizobium japonicum TaxID=375 RepID=UPI0021684BEE|nr:efflux RND transporter permease subunit [Bradyrhizobium japonicum]MCS3495462.1 multidrug efflux pump subunit AcrB [Bradyrhizobium japonicum]MCS3962375.1 multidrug efflux pump subunit AcrB [Bradyrhizobium japonicum]MCS3994692.1 multidrug efflux pump subunit AcrB [Bradyrhizobium japonicum]